MLAGKRDSRCHSTTSFNKNVEVAEKSYQMLEDLSFCDQERDYPPLIKKTVLTFQVKKSTIKLSFHEYLYYFHHKESQKKKCKN